MDESLPFLAQALSGSQGAATPFPEDYGPWWVRTQFREYTNSVGDGYRQPVGYIDGCSRTRTCDPLIKNQLLRLGSVMRSDPVTTRFLTR